MAEVKDYPGNSNKSREEKNDIRERRVEKVVKGEVVNKKKSLGSKFRDTFVADDAVNVKDYILFDVLIPALRDAAFDMIRSGAEMIFYGESGPRRSSGGRSSYNSNTSRTSYSRYYEDRNRREEKKYSSPRDRYSFDDIILDNRGDAEDVLDAMFDILKEYGSVSIADLYDLVGMETTYTDNKYGWEDLGSAAVQRVRDGYVIKLPRVRPID